MEIKGLKNKPWNINENNFCSYNNLTYIKSYYTYNVDSNHINWKDRFTIEVVYNSINIFQSIQIKDIHPHLPEFTYWDIKSVDKLANNKVLCTYQYNFWNTHGIDILKAMVKYPQSINPFEPGLNLSVRAIYSPNINIPNRLNYLDGDIYSPNDITINLKDYDNSRSSLVAKDAWSFYFNHTNKKYEIKNKAKDQLGVTIRVEEAKLGIKYCLIVDPFKYGPTEEGNNFYDSASYILIPILADKNSWDSQLNRWNYNTEEIIPLLLNGETSWYSIDKNNKMYLNIDLTHNYGASGFIGVFEFLPFDLLIDYNQIVKYAVTSPHVTGSIDDAVTIYALRIKNNVDAYYKLNESTDKYHPPVVYKQNFNETINLNLKETNNTYMSTQFSPYIFFNAEDFTPSLFNKIYYTGVISMNIDYRDINNTDNLIVSSNTTLPYYTDEYLSYVNATKNSANTSYQNAQRRAGAQIGGGAITATIGIASIITGLLTLNPVMVGVGVGGVAGGISTLASGAISSQNIKDSLESNYADKKNAAGMIQSGLTKSVNTSLDLWYSKRLKSLINDSFDLNKLTINIPIPGYTLKNKQPFNDNYLYFISDDNFLKWYKGLDDWDLFYNELFINFQLWNNSYNLSIINELIQSKYPYFNDDDISQILNKLSSNIIKLRYYSI